MLSLSYTNNRLFIQPTSFFSIFKHHCNGCNLIIIQLWMPNDTATTTITINTALEIINHGATTSKHSDFLPHVKQ